MQNNWKTYKLGDVLQIKNGKSKPKGIGVIPIYGGNGILGYTDKYNNDSDVVIIGRVGAYCGSVYFEDKPIWISDNAMSAKVKVFGSDKFYYYVLKHLDLNSYAGGSSQPLLTQSTLNSINIKVPDLPEQKAIANILSAIDDKIENNLAIIKTLEDMAMALYKNWFVDFGPFQDGEFIDSELGLIPKGWEVVRVDTIASIVDPHPSHRAPKAVENGYPFAGIGDIDEMGNINLLKARQVGIEAVDRQAKSYEINNYTVGFGRVGTVGKVVKLRPQEFRYSISPTLAVINSKEKSFEEFIYFMVKSFAFQNQVKNNQTGSTRPTIGIQTLRALLIAIPTNNKVINSFKDKVKSYYSQGDILNKENQTLSLLRDTLLPKLISGEVRLKEFKERVEKVI